MIREQVFTDMSCYPKVSDTATPIDAVEWFAKNVGITNLDDPSVKIKTIIDDVNECELARQKARKEREAKAQDAFLDAMFNLNNGTAELRQKGDRTKPAAKQLKVAKKVAKPTTRGRALGFKAGEYKEAKARRVPIVAKLKAGEFIEVLQQDESIERQREYSQQYSDISHIRSNLGLKVARVRCSQRGVSFYAIDAFPRYESEVAISGTISDKNLLLQALLSRELVLASDLTCSAKVASRNVMSIMRKHDLDIYTVFSGSTTEGWIFIPNKEKQQAKIHDLGDMLQALDYLKDKKEKAGQ
ncbi:hypothetical protein [Psychrobacter sp. AOP31-E1-50]|uniref:hypothetical protein n=1 Tax=Psychrobacter sp. AOP31-E1-50 TaxID=3457692 RepID=UPI004036CF1B